VTRDAPNRYRHPEVSIVRSRAGAIPQKGRRTSYSTSPAVVISALNRSDTSRSIVIPMCKTEEPPDGSCSGRNQPALIKMILVAALLSADTTAAKQGTKNDEDGSEEKRRSAICDA
jgi:hypothetical protein